MAPTPHTDDDWEDEDEERAAEEEREDQCPRCGGTGECALISGIEWDYVGPDYGTCPRCEGTGKR